MRSHNDGLSRRVTIRQVAENAGVSVSAVSKVLRDAYGVSASLRARVEASIETLHYRPLSAARGMRGRTYTVGLVLPDIRNPLFAEFLNGLVAGLEDTQYRCILGVAEAANEDAVLESMIDRQVDGVVIVGSVQEEDRLHLLASRVPLVLVGYHCEDTPAFDAINGNDVEGACVAVRHLIANGHQNVAMLSLASVPSTIVAKRELGYRLTMMESGLGDHVRVVHAPNRPGDIQNTAHDLLGQQSRPSAVFCWSDLAALELIGMALNLGLAVPGDLGVVGYDNSTFCELGQNSLSSIDQSGRHLGEHAGRMLLERIEGRSQPSRMMIEPTLVVRASSAPNWLASGRGEGRI